MYRSTLNTARRLLPTATVMAASVLAICAIGASGNARAGEIDQVLTFSEFPSAEVCRTCHKSIYDQWRASRHRAAWTAPLFRSQSSDHRIDGCLGCHAPAERVTSETPAVRSVFQYEGVTCASCHWDESGVIHGPRGGPAPHPTRRDPNLTTAESCRTCHLFGNTFTQWQHSPLAQQGVTCQQCHQSAEESLVADGAAARAYGLEQRPVAGHLWPGSSDSLFRASSVQASVTVHEEGRSAGEVTVTLQNVGAGHAVPTGWYQRRIDLELQLRSATGDSLGHASYSVTTVDSSMLVPYQPRDIRVSFNAAIPPDGEIVGTLYSRLDPSMPRMFMSHQSWPTAATASLDVDIEGWPE